MSCCCPALDSRWLVGMKVRRGRGASRNCAVSVRTLPCPALNASSRGDRSSNEQPCPPQPISQKTKTKRSSRSKVAHAGQEEHPPTKIRTTRRDPRAPPAAATTLPKTTTTTTTFELPCVLACLSPLSPGRVPVRCMPITQGRAVGWMRKKQLTILFPPLLQPQRSAQPRGRGRPRGRPRGRGRGRGGARVRPPRISELKWVPGDGLGPDGDVRPPFSLPPPSARF